jgi:outer membrane protein OmpU
MKRILLAGTALVGVALFASSAHAELKTDIGGYFRGYGVWADNDEDAAGASLRQFEFRRDSELHFNGEATTDRGLTVGAHTEIKTLGDGDSDGTGGFFRQSIENPSIIDESYLYVSGGWGRFNFGSEDGAAYLLQVAAPSADSNVDGLRVYIQALNSDVWDDGSVNVSFLDPSSTFPTDYTLGYDNADFRNTDRLTYLTPKWNGFQAGVSYAPKAGQNLLNSNIAGMSNDDGDNFEDLWEASARWDGEFEGWGISLGGGYSRADEETTAAAGGFQSDDLITWDAGLNLAFRNFSLGGAYKTSNTATNSLAGSDSDVRTWVVGLGWDNGPYHAGASWNNTRLDDNAYGATFGGATPDDIEIDRFTVGGGYTYGPGMTFRGAVSFGNVDSSFDDGIVGPVDTGTDFTQVTVGTDVQF